MLFVGPAWDQRNAHICNGRAGQYADVGLLPKMRENQTLPMAVQQVLRAGRAAAQAASTGQGFQKQMHLRIVPQRFEMPYPLHRSGDCLPIHYPARAKVRRHAETLQKPPP